MVEYWDIDKDLSKWNIKSYYVAASKYVIGF